MSRATPASWARHCCRGIAQHDRVGSAALLRRTARHVDVPDVDAEAGLVRAAVLERSTTNHAGAGAGLGPTHRDIKPANLFLTSGDEEIIVEILDFGIAKVLVEQAHDASETSQLTRTGSLLGSPQYMSPEQAHGLKDIGSASDVWSLGVLLHKMLTGVTPYHYVHELGNLIVAITTRKPRPVHLLAPWVPEPVAELLSRALAPKPRDRYPDAGAMLEDLRPLLPGGWALKPSELTALDPVQRRELDERLAVTIREAEETVSPGPISPTGHPPTAADDDARTNTALAHSNEEGRVRRRRWPIAMALGVITLAAAAAAVVALEPTSLGFPSRSEPLPAVPPVASEIPPMTPFSAAVAPTVKRRLLVDPSDATVTVAGRSAELADGGVEIEAKVGAALDVVVASGRHKQSRTVTVTANGLDPARIEHPLAMQAAPNPPAPPVARTQPNTAWKTAASSGAASPSPSPPATNSATEVGARRKFE